MFRDGAKYNIDDGLDLIEWGLLITDGGKQKPGCMRFIMHKETNTFMILITLIDEVAKAKRCSCGEPYTGGVLVVGNEHAFVVYDCTECRTITTIQQKEIGFFPQLVKELMHIDWDTLRQVMRPGLDVKLGEAWMRELK